MNEQYFMADNLQWSCEYTYEGSNFEIVKLYRNGLDVSWLLDTQLFPILYDAAHLAVQRATPCEQLELDYGV